MPNILSRVDVMVRMLIVAILLATFLPVTGAMRDTAQVISNIAVFILFFLNGVRLSRTEVVKGLANWKLLVPLVLWCFGAMTLAGWGLYQFSAGFLPPLVAVGLLYLGCLPSTVQSAAAYSSIAGGNVASSVVSAALLNLLGVFVTAPIFAWASGGAAVQLGGSGLTKIFMVLLLPFMLGQLVQSHASPLLKRKPALVGWMDRISIAIAVYVAFSGAVEQNIWTRLDVASWSYVLGLLAALLVFAFAGAWALARMLRLSEGDQISFVFAGAHKSVAMGAPLALVLFTPDRAGLILVPLLIYHLLQLVISAPLANHFARTRPPS